MLIKVLDRIFIRQMFRSSFLLLLASMPFLYLTDLLFSPSFDPLEALAKLPYRYGQSLSSLLLWSSWLAMQVMRKKYASSIFITIGFRVRHAWRAVLIFALVWMSLDCFVLIPLNDLFFDPIVKKTNWSVKQLEDQTVFIHKKNDQQIELCMNHDKQVIFQELQWKNHRFKLNEKEVRLVNEDFYIFWDEPKKLSWKGLDLCQKYLQYQNLDPGKIIVQRHVFITRVLLIFGMVLTGFVLGWREGLLLIVCCSVLSNWVLQIVIFMPTMLALVSLWINVLFWIGFGLCFLL